MSDSTTKKPIRILLVEDNPDDADWTVEKLEELNVEATIVEDGAQAIDFLRQRGDYVGFSRPHLILLDLRLPKKTGWEVLAEIHPDNRLSRIPVIIMTGADSQVDDCDKVAQFGVKRFLNKPVNQEKFLSAVKEIIDDDSRTEPENRMPGEHRQSVVEWHSAWDM